MEREGAGLGVRLFRVVAGVQPLIGVSEHHRLLLFPRSLRIYTYATIVYSWFRSVLGKTRETAQQT